MENVPLQSKSRALRNSLAVVVSHNCSSPVHQETTSNYLPTSLQVISTVCSPTARFVKAAKRMNADGCTGLTCLLLIGERSWLPRKSFCCKITVLQQLRHYGGISVSRLRGSSWTRLLQLLMLSPFWSRSACKAAIPRQ